MSAHTCIKIMSPGKMLLSIISFSFCFGFSALHADQNSEDLRQILKADEEQAIDQLLLDGEALRQNSKVMRESIPFETSKENIFGMLMSGPDDVVNPTIPQDGSNPFPTDPIDPGNGSIPGWDDSMFPAFGFQQKNGAAERVAMMVLYQTLNFYGVEHTLKRVNTTVDFKIIKSTSGYFTDITKLDVAYAIREFGRYLRAMMCNNASMENFYRMFAQVPKEEIGLRFKYDMAWALLGNTLPKTPQEIMKLSTRWTALQQIINTTNVTKIDDPQRAKTFRTWLGTLSDVVKIMVGINQFYCMVDMRPVPKLELKKRVVIHNLLEFGKDLNKVYDQYRDVIDQSKKMGQQLQVAYMRSDM